jgi:hypothetical protein
MTIDGSCLCGAVAFELTPPLSEVISCHCTQCRKTSGHYWASTGVPLVQFRLTKDDGLAWFQSSDTAKRGFCKFCGSSLFWQPNMGARIAVSAGALNGDTGIREAKHIFVDDKGGYYDIDNNLPKIGQY